MIVLLSISNCVVMGPVGSSGGRLTGTGTRHRHKWATLVVLKRGCCDWGTHRKLTVVVTGLMTNDNIIRSWRDHITDV